MTGRAALRYQRAAARRVRFRPARDPRSGAPGAGGSRGRAVPVRPGLVALQPGVNASFPTHDELEAALHAKLERRIVQMMGGSDNGEHEMTPPGLPPDRHFSYAIQWWGFALVLLVLYFGLNFRKVP